MAETPTPTDPRVWQLGEGWVARVLPPAQGETALLLARGDLPNEVRLNLDAQERRDLATGLTRAMTQNRGFAVHDVVNTMSITSTNRCVTFSLGFSVCMPRPVADALLRVLEEVDP